MHSPVYRACNGFTLLLFYLQYAALATLTFVGMQCLPPPRLLWSHENETDWHRSIWFG
jgi:hypothetical protein